MVPLRENDEHFSLKNPVFCPFGAIPFVRKQKTSGRNFLFAIQPFFDWMSNKPHRKNSLFSLRKFQPFRVYRFISGLNLKALT